MSTAQFITDHFLNKEIKLLIGGDGEWLQYADSTVMNTEFMCGTVLSVESEIIVLKTPGGTAYIPADQVRSFYHPDFEYDKACHYQKGKSK